jgi:hypothetical protein
VKWDALARCYVTRTDPSSPLDALPTSRSWALSRRARWLEPIIHGNGRWVVFKKSELLPHCSADATLLPAALVWPCHAFANRDWRKGSASHGNAKVVGELDENTALDRRDGNPTRRRPRSWRCSPTIASQDMPYGIKPAKREGRSCSRTRRTCGRSFPSSRRTPRRRPRESTSGATASSARKAERPASTSPRCSACTW